MITSDKTLFLKEQWELFKNNSDNFWKRMEDIILKENDFDELLNLIPSFFNNLWCIDFETETYQSKSFQDYLKETGRTRSRVNYYFMVNMLALKREHLGKYNNQKTNNDLMLQGTKIDEIFEFFFNQKIKSFHNEVTLFFHNINFDGLFVKQWLDKNNYKLINKDGFITSNNDKYVKKVNDTIKKNKDKQLSLNNIIENNQEVFNHKYVKSYYVDYNQGKITKIIVYMRNYQNKNLKIIIGCSLKLLSQSSSIESLGKTFGLNKKDETIASNENYEKFLAKSYKENIIDVYKDDIRYPFYCMRDVFIQSVAVLTFYQTIYHNIKNNPLYKGNNKAIMQNTYKVVKSVFTISKASLELAKVLLPKEQQKNLSICVGDRLIYDRETKGGLTNYNVRNELIIFHKNYIDKMEFKNMGCDDIKSAYPHKLLKTPNGKVFLNEPDDYNENPDKYGVMYGIGYTNIRAKNLDNKIGILKDYLNNALTLIMDWKNVSYKESFKIIKEYTINDAKSSFDGYEPFKKMIDFYGIDETDFNLSDIALKEKYNKIFNVEKIGRLISSANKYYTYGTTDLINEIERYFNFDSKVIYEKYYFELDTYLSDVINNWFSLKENGKGAIKQMIKIFINSFYGKTAQGYIFPYVIAKNEEVNFTNDNNIEYCNLVGSNKEKYLMVNYEVSKKSKMYCDSNKQYICYKTNPLNKRCATNKLIANWCTNQTQAQLLKAINDNNPNNHIYSDTDSRIWLNNNPKNLHNGSNLGDWENEFLVEFVKVKGYDGYCCKVYKNSKINNKTIDINKYRIIENTDKYFIFDKYYIMVSIAIRQKTYFFVILDLKNLKVFNKYDCDKLLEIFNNNNKGNELNDTDLRLIISEILTGYDNSNGEFVTHNIILKKAHSGVKRRISQDELFHLLMWGIMVVDKKDMSEEVADDGGSYFMWVDKIISTKRIIKIDGYNVAKIEYQQIYTINENDYNIENIDNFDFDAEIKLYEEIIKNDIIRDCINGNDNNTNELHKNVNNIFNDKNKGGD